jgi:hypothetical protein
MPCGNEGDEIIGRQQTTRAQPRYEVGYGRPPKAHRFTKGRSGNPAGAPKREARNLHAVLEDAFAERIVARTNGRPQRVSKLEAMLSAEMQAALRGDARAVRHVLSLAKKSNRFSDSRKLIGVLTYTDPEAEAVKAEYHALKAAGKL